MKDVVLITGGTGFIGRRLLKRLLDSDKEVWVLSRRDSVHKTEAILRSMGQTQDKWHIAQGDVMRRGLLEDRALAADLAERVTQVIHLAAVYDLTVPMALGMAVNVGGTENVLDFCQGAKRLGRLLYGSTVAISGRHPGVFREEDLDIGQRFRNAYDHTKFLAERLVRGRQDRIRTVIVRPTIVVGDSRTGEMDKVDGPYYLFRAIAMNMHLALPNPGITKCHAVPVDFVVEAIAFLLDHPKATGRTFCIGDPKAISYDEFIDLSCELWPRRKPLLKLPPWIMELNFSIPGVARILGIPKESLAYTVIPVEYTFDNLTEILTGSGIECPGIREVLPRLIEYFKAHMR